MTRTHTKKNGTRPALVQPCDSADDHAKHAWIPDFATNWPEGAFWHCPGRDNAEMAEGVRATERAIRRARKQKS